MVGSTVKTIDAVVLTSTLELIVCKEVCKGKCGWLMYRRKPEYAHLLLCVTDIDSHDCRAKGLQGGRIAVIFPSDSSLLTTIESGTANRLSHLDIDKQSRRLK